MNFAPLPKKIVRVLTPPLKCQGIKRKLVDFIAGNIRWDGKGYWTEPFLGSGVVLFNVQPERAKVCDINPHVIALYQGIYDRSLTPQMVRDHLTSEGEKLANRGEAHYYAVRERFNESGLPLDYLFLNRSCFNGLVRFNKKGNFNVPFCRKPERFRRAYVTKIVNQVIAVGRIMWGKQWEFRTEDWRSSLKKVGKDDFVYLDPPYIGRHTDYYNQWSDRDAVDLAKAAQILPCGVALSMWKKNRYRTNSHIPEHWNWAVERTTTHFYHIGSTENLRNSMEEALLIKPGYETAMSPNDKVREPHQMTLPLTAWVPE